MAPVWTPITVGETTSFYDLPLAEAWLAYFNATYMVDAASPGRWAGHVQGATLALGNLFRALNLKPMSVPAYVNAMVAAYGGTLRDRSITNDTGWFPFPAQGRSVDIPNGTVRAEVVQWFKNSGHSRANDQASGLAVRARLSPVGVPIYQGKLGGVEKVTVPQGYTGAGDYYFSRGAYEGTFPGNASVENEFLWNGQPFAVLVLAPSLRETLGVLRDVVTRINANAPYGGLPGLFSEVMAAQGLAAQLYGSPYEVTSPTGWTRGSAADTPPATSTAHGIPPFALNADAQLMVDNTTDAAGCVGWRGMTEAAKRARAEAQSDWGSRTHTAEELYTAAEALCPPAAGSEAPATGVAAEAQRMVDGTPAPNNGCAGWMSMSKLDRDAGAAAHAGKGTHGFSAAALSAAATTLCATASGSTGGGGLLGWLGLGGGGASGGPTPAQVTAEAQRMVDGTPAPNNGCAGWRAMSDNDRRVRSVAHAGWSGNTIHATADALFAAAQTLCAAAVDPLAALRARAPDDLNADARLMMSGVGMTCAQWLLSATNVQSQRAEDHSTWGGKKHSAGDLLGAANALCRGEAPPTPLSDAELQVDARAMLDTTPNAAGCAGWRRMTATQRKTRSDAHAAWGLRPERTGAMLLAAADAICAAEQADADRRAAADNESARSAREAEAARVAREAEAARVERERERLAALRPYGYTPSSEAYDARVAWLRERQAETDRQNANACSFTTFTDRSARDAWVTAHPSCPRPPDTSIAVPPTTDNVPSSRPTDNVPSSRPPVMIEPKPLWPWLLGGAAALTVGGVVIYFVVKE